MRRSRHSSRRLFAALACFVWILGFEVPPNVHVGMHELFGHHHHGPRQFCECGGGSHPLVEGDLRYCEEGHYYCGDLMMKPPIDVCYAVTVADPCCPIDLKCY